MQWVHVRTGEPVGPATPRRDRVKVPACQCGRLTTSDTVGIRAATILLLADAEDCATERSVLRHLAVNLMGAGA